MQNLKEITKQNISDKGNINMNKLNILDRLQKEYGDSFYLFNIEKLRSNYLEMFSAFSNRYNNFIIGYSYKTNYLPALIKEMSNIGAYAEVVSRLEYNLAMKIGVDSNKIIFNGPFKTYEDIALALEGNSIINLDSFYEIELVKKYVLKNKNRNYKVGIRVSFDITIDGSNSLQGGFKQSRFGFCAENGNLMKALNKLNQIENLDIVGFHGHFSTGTRSLDTFRKITQKLCDLSKTYLVDTLEYINVGGGFFGHVPETMNIKNVPSFDDYAKAICSIINKEKVNFKNNPFLIIEPGLAMVVDTFNFYSKVIDVKRNQDELFVLVNGSIHNIKPSLHKKNMPMKLTKKSNGEYSKWKYNVVGITCMEKDYLAIDYYGEIPKPGDFLSFSNVGAYTIVLDPPFINERPPIISCEKNSYKLVRRREKLNEFINDNVYIF